MDEKHKARIVGLTMGLAMAMTVGLLPGGGSDDGNGRDRRVDQKHVFFQPGDGEPFPLVPSGHGSEGCGGGLL